MKAPDLLDEIEKQASSDYTGPKERSGKHLLFINQHYSPDIAATGQYLADLCEYLGDQGYRVTVICSRGKYLSGRQDVPSHEWMNGVEVIRVPATSMGRASHIKRLFDYATFMLLTLWHALFRLEKPELVCSLTTPPMLGLIGYILRGLRGSKYVIWSMDLHPEAERAVGMLPPFKPAVSFLFNLGRFIYRKADAVVSLGSEMTRLISKYPVTLDRIFQIPIWADSREIHPIDTEECREYFSSIPEYRDKFIVNYSGNIGLVHDLNAICKVIQKLRNREDILFLFNGGGPRIGDLQNFVKKNELHNVEFHPYVDRDQLACALSRADVHWFSLKRACTGIAVPSKSVGYMASGIPQIFIGADEADNAQIIREAGCGYALEPEQIDSIVERILMLKSDAQLRGKLGQNGLTYFKNYLDKPISCAQWWNMIDSLVPNYGQETAAAIIQNGN